MTLNLFGVNFKVQPTTIVSGEQTLGCIMNDQAIIEINPEFPYQVQSRALLHELIHSVLHQSGLHELFEKNKIDLDSVINIISKGLYDIFQINQKELKQVFFP
jgi:hypothetical protein